MTVEIIGAEIAREDTFKRAAERMFNVLSKQDASAPLCVGLCGGRSIVNLLQAMREEARKQPTSVLERLHFFMVDERLVPLDDPQSNFGMLKSLFFDELCAEGLITANQLHPFEASLETGTFECKRYWDLLRSRGGRLSVVIVGMGEDGHIAGLFPKYPALQEQERGFVTFGDSPKPPPDRMTITRSLLRDAQLSILLALGEGKRDAWNTFRTPGVDAESCPALLATLNEECVVVTDLA